MKHCLSLLALLFLGLSLPAAAGGVSPADEVWADFAEALGGFEALESVETRIVHGRYLEDLSWKEPRQSSYAISAYYWWDMSTVLHYRPGGTLHEFWDRHVRHVKENGKWRTEDGGDLPTRWWVDPQLLAHADVICDEWKLQPPESSPGRRILKGTDDFGSARVAEFDAESGLLLRLDHWTFEEYRKLGDVLMPARIVESRKGGHSAWQADRVQQDVPLPPELLGR